MSSGKRTASRSAKKKAAPSKDETTKKRGEGSKVRTICVVNLNSINMWSLLRHLLHLQSHSTSMLQSLMLLSHTKPIQRDTFAHSKLLILVFTSKTKREQEILAIMLLLCSMQRDLKIYQSYKELETLLEFTEQL